MGLSPFHRRAAREFFQALLDAVAPPRCAACGQLGCELCEACCHRLVRLQPPLCERCGEPLGGAPACPADHGRIAGLACARAALAYRGAAADLVHRMKFAHDPGATRFLVRALAAAAPAVVGSRRRTVVVSVPLHPRKLRRRGFDQAAILARGLAERRGLAFVPHALSRVRETLPQGDPRVLSRQRNVEGAFAVARPRRIAARGVWLVDDVTTSGATARACAAALRAAGATEVALITAARA